MRGDVVRWILLACGFLSGCTGNVATAPCDDLCPPSDDGGGGPPPDGPGASDGASGEGDGGGDGGGGLNDGGVVSGVGYLPADRSIEWKPGVPGGIPSYPQGASVAPGAGDDTSAIQSALDSAPSDTAVVLAAGTYEISGALSIPAHKVLRGAGPEATILACTTSTCVRLGSGGGGTYGSVTAGFQLGSTQITVADSSAFSVGKYANIRQDWDPSYFHCGYDNGGVCPSWGDAAVGQTLKIIGKTGNVLTTETPLYFGYTAAFNPRMSAQSKTELAGIEDLRVEKSSPNSGASFTMANCASCWIKNIWSEKAADFHVDVTYSYRSEIRDSVFNGMIPTSNGSITYGVRLQARSSDMLIENNVFNYMRHAMAMEIGPSGNVWGYNCSKDPWSSASPGWLFSDIALHGHYPTMNLYEGNVAQKVAIDNVWGSHGPNTLFRNRIERSVATVSSPSAHSPIDVDPWNPLQNLLGNDLGMTGQTANDGPIYLAPDIASSILVHGNYDYMSGQITKWEASLSQTLPASLYLGGKPAWWDASPWPAFGPDTDHTGAGNKIPAQTRFDQLRAAGKL